LIIINALSAIANDDLTCELSIELADVILMMIQLLEMNLPIERIAVSESLRTNMKVNATVDSPKGLLGDLMLRLRLSHLRPEVPASYHHNQINSLDNTDV
jgi:hypothetical protein